MGSLDKYICIDAGDTVSLTNNKIYEGKRIKEDVFIINDKNVIKNYKSTRFLTIEEYRDLKINEILKT